MNPNNKQSAYYQTGFSLVEIMVGLVIGLLATMVVLQVFSVFEGQKRTTMGTADAQTNGNIALFTIKRELEMAGYGLLPVTTSPLECAAPIFADSGVTGLAPVIITDGGTGPGASDTITLRYSTSDIGGSFARITAAIGNAAPKIASVGDYLGCNIGDVVMIVGSATCNLTRVEALSLAPDFTGITLTTAALDGTNSGSDLACLGAWREIEYRINANYNPAAPYDPLVPSKSQAYLQRNETPAVAANAVPIVVDIVNIQAQYGISATASSNQITQWVNAVDGLPTGNWSAASLSLADRNRIKAVRIAVVARNGLMEKDIVTQAYNANDACSSLTSDTPAGVCAWSGSSSGTIPPSNAPNINLSNDPNWQYYRYRVFETIIPLRNVIWSRSTL